MHCESLPAMQCTAVLIVSQATSEKLHRRTLAACKALPDYTNAMLRTRSSREGCRMLRRLARGMLLLQPASGTLEHRTQPWNDFLNFMGSSDQQNSLTPAETVAHPPAGSHGGLSVAGLDLFADLDLDTLLGSTATSSAQPSRATVAQLTSSATPYGLPHHSIMSGVPAAWNAPMTHHAAAYTAQQQPATLCAPTWPSTLSFHRTQPSVWRGRARRPIWLPSLHLLGR